MTDIKNYTLLESDFDIPDEEWIEMTTNKTNISNKILPVLDIETNNKLLENLLMQITKLIKTKKVPTKNIEDIINIYDQTVLIKLIKKYVNDTNMPEIVPFILPKIDEPIIFELIKTKTSVKILQNLKIDVCKIDKYNKTILFYIRDSNYLLDFLELNIIDSIINHKCNDGDTFFDVYQEDSYSARNSEHIYNIITLLEKKRFVFDNKPKVLKLSLMDRTFMAGAHKNEGALKCIEKIISRCHIISHNLFWVNILVQNCVNSCKFTNSIIEHILKRHDYKTFIINLVSHASNESDILHMFNHLYLSNKFNEMLKEKNSLGSNVLHLLSLYHYDKIIRFLCVKISPEFMKSLNIKNINGDYPLDIYNKYDIKNILQNKYVESSILENKTDT